jgi:hypothetical protein
MINLPDNKSMVLRKIGIWNEMHMAHEYHLNRIMLIEELLNEGFLKIVNDKPSHMHQVWVKLSFKGLWYVKEFNRINSWDGLVDVGPLYATI